LYRYNTAAVLEHNDIDAVEVHGDDVDGSPLDDFSPVGLCTLNQVDP
jgi:hypothetical protein